MIRGFRALPFRRRDAAERDQPSNRYPMAAPARRFHPDDLALDDAPVGPLILLPSAIYRQVIYDPTPTWARPRPATTPERLAVPASVAAPDVAEPAAPAEPPKPKRATRTRKPKTSGSATQAPTGVNPRRARKPRTDRQTTT